MSGSLAPSLRQRYFDSDGNPLAGGKLYSYQSGTSTPQATYTSATLGTPNANPVVLDANGEADVWLDPTLSYKFVLKNSSDVTQWTVDSVIGLLTPDAVNTASIQDGAVTTAKIADDAVTAGKLRDDPSIDANRAVTTNHIRDLAITRAKMTTGAVAPDAVTGTKTADYPMTSADDFIPVDGTSGTITITLAALAGVLGRRVKIFRIDAAGGSFPATIDGNGSETINGATTVPLIRQYEGYELEAVTGGWIIVNHFMPAIPWTSYTPATYQGLGTPTGVNMFYKYDPYTKTLAIKGSLAVGTVTGSEARVDLPSGFQTNASLPAILLAGYLVKNGNDAAQNVILMEPSKTYFTFGSQSSGSSGMTKIPGTTLHNNGGGLSLFAEFPVI